MRCQTDHLLSVRSGIRVLASLNLNSFVCPIFICSLWWGSKGFTNKALPSNLQRTVIPIYLEGHYWSTLQTKDRKEGCWLQISSICLGPRADGTGLQPFLLNLLTHYCDQDHSTYVRTCQIITDQNCGHRPAECNASGLYIKSASWPNVGETCSTGIQKIWIWSQFCLLLAKRVT